MHQDDDQLRLLSIFHYVVGAIIMLGSLLPLVHVTVGASLLANANLFEIRSEQTSPGARPPGDPSSPAESHGSLAVRSALPSIVAWVFVVAGVAFVLVGETIGICLLLAGRAIARRRRHLFVLVVACVQCVIFPIGTALGVCTLLVLSRASVKERFEGAPAAGI